MVSSGFAGISQTLTLLVHSRYIDDHNTYGAYAAATLLMGIALVVLLLMTVLDRRGATDDHRDQPPARTTARSPRSTTSASRFPRAPLTALLGPSGSGKSTLLRSIAGLETLDSGAVTIQAATSPTSRPSGAHRLRLPALRRLQAHDGARQTSRSGSRSRKRPKAEIDTKVNDLLEIVGLEGFRNRYPRAALRRQRQRMALARPSPSTPRCCSSTSRSVPSTRRCAPTCASGCAACHDEVHVTTVSSRTTRRRRSTSRTHRGARQGTLQTGRGPGDALRTPRQRLRDELPRSVSRLGDQLVRPHDIVIEAKPRDGARARRRRARLPRVVTAVVERVVPLGFESGSTCARGRRPLRSAVSRRDGGRRPAAAAGEVVAARAIGRSSVVETAALAI